MNCTFHCGQIVWSVCKQLFGKCRHPFFFFFFFSGMYGLLTWLDCNLNIPCKTTISVQSITLLFMFFKSSLDLYVCFFISFTYQAKFKNCNVYDFDNVSDNFVLQTLRHLLFNQHCCIFPVDRFVFMISNNTFRLNSILSIMNICPLWIFLHLVYWCFPHISFSISSIPLLGAILFLVSLWGSI